MSGDRHRPAALDREVRDVLSEAARGPGKSGNLLRGFERRCRRFLEEERWARITLRWAVVAGTLLAVLLLVERVRRPEPGPPAGPLAMDVGEYFQDTTLEEGHVLTALVVGEVPE